LRLGPSAVLNVHLLAAPPKQQFPLPLDQYGEPAQLGIAETLKRRIAVEPFNLVDYN
jgi:hypothetical protein